MIEYSREAAEDVDRHHEWLLALSTRAAAAFMAQIALTETRLTTRPRAYRILKDNATRRATFRLRRTTYHLDFQIENNGIVVLRVWHGRQDRPD